MPEFPASWALMPVSEVVCNITITDKKIPQKDYLSNGKYPVFDQGQKFVGGYTDDVSKVVDCTLPVIVFGDHTRAVKLVKSKFAPGADGVKILQPNQCFLPELLEYFVRYLVTKIPNNGYARHYQHLAKSLIPVPPYPEQQRITAKLEELFSELDKGIESLKTAQAQLKVYRQALLKHAFEGKLTAQWRADNSDKLETADALPKRIQQECAQSHQRQFADHETARRQNSKLRTPKPLSPLSAEELTKLPELPASWKWVRAGEIISDSMIGLDKGAKFQSAQPPGVPYIKMNNVTMDGRVLTNRLVYVEVNQDEAIRFSLCEGDILLNTRNSRELVGKTGIVRRLAEHTIYNNNLMRIRTTNGVSAYFLSHQLCSPGFKERLESAKKGTTNVSAVYAKDFFPLIVAVAPLAEQQQIVEIVEYRLSEVDQLEQTITSSLQQAEALRQSILKKAFSGQLVPQDPHDESASALLARIKAEKSASPQSKKARQ